MSEYFYLPGVLREIADVAGLPAALAIAEVKGGARVHFPARSPEGHWLRELVGGAAADALCDHFRTRGRRRRDQGCDVDIPLGPKGFYMKARKRALEMLAEGLSTYEIARRLGVDRSTVRRLKAAERAAVESRTGPQPSTPPRQGSLF